MDLTWLHISDFHIRSGDPYDRDVVLRALVKSVEEFRRTNRSPDLILATGDVAYSGKAEEYDLATKLFDDLIDAAGLEKNRLFIIPGNHDVDRSLSIGLARTLESREECDGYFNAEVPKPHLVQKLGAFLKWHNDYFKGIRAMPADSTCGPVELMKIRGHKIGILPVNTALFSRDDNDHDKLLVGRRCLDVAIERFRALTPDFRIALMHHPLEWLSSVERSNIKEALLSSVDFVLRGHLHETEVESVASASGASLICAAGAAYQSRRWPNRATYATIKGSHLAVFPIRYEDQPQEVWTVDPSLFPSEEKHGYQKTFPIPRLMRNRSASLPDSVPDSPESVQLPRFRSNIPSRQNRRLVGRDAELAEILTRLGPTSNSAALVLHGSPGVGKSELAREFGRRHRSAYPGGTFVIDGSSGSLFADFAAIGKNILGLNFLADTSLPDQGGRTFYALQAPVLLIYDNVRSPQSISPWLTPADMAGHILITTVVENWEPGWSSLEVKPLSQEQSLELIEELAGRDIATRYGQELANLAGGLPVQICPPAAVLAYEQRRGHLDSAVLTLSAEAVKTFLGVYESLEPPARLVLLGAAFLNTQRIPRSELFRHFGDGVSWAESQFQKNVDACLDLHLLEGNTDLRMHRLLARFLLGLELAAQDAEALRQVRQAQRLRFLELTKEVSEHPNRTDQAAALLVFPLAPENWTSARVEISTKEAGTVGISLYEIGHFEEALGWFRNAVEAKQKGGSDGRIDHESLGISLHQVGACLSNTGKFEEALPWFKRAVEAAEKGDVHGRVDHASLSASVHQVGACLSNTGKFEEALPWFQRAVEAAEKGDVHGRVDRASLGRSLGQVGGCLFNTGKFEDALPWYQRAVEAKQKGDMYGRVDHESLGASLHQVGTCLSHTGKFEEALPWFQRAVEAAEKGDVHGRVDDESLGRSLHQVGSCLSNTGKFEEALLCYQHAVEAKQKGDVHGRVDHASLGTSLHQVGFCLSNTGKFEEALLCYQRAAEANQKGDVHGRVDQSSSSVTFRTGAQCLRKLGREAEAREWEDKASKLR